MDNRSAYVSERGCVRILAHDPQNRHLFDSRQRLKQTAINTGRGSLVRHVALRQALTSGANCKEPHSTYEPTSAFDLLSVYTARVKS